MATTNYFLLSQKLGVDLAYLKSYKSFASAVIDFRNTAQEVEYTDNSLALDDMLTDLLESATRDIISYTHPHLPDAFATLDPNQPVELLAINNIKYAVCEQALYLLYNKYEEVSNTPTLSVPNSFNTDAGAGVSSLVTNVPFNMLISLRASRFIDASNILNYIINNILNNPYNGSEEITIGTDTKTLTQWLAEGPGAAPSDQVTANQPDAFSNYV